jgi:colicin import membrane protein
LKEQQRKEKKLADEAEEMKRGEEAAAIADAKANAAAIAEEKRAQENIKKQKEALRRQKEEEERQLKLKKEKSRSTVQSIQQGTFSAVNAIQWTLGKS